MVTPKETCIVCGKKMEQVNITTHWDDEMGKTTYMRCSRCGRIYAYPEESTVPISLADVNA